MAKECGFYRVFGFGVRAEMPLPELMPADLARDPSGPSGEACDVSIGIGDAARPDGLIEIAPGVAADRRRFWMDVPDVARILVWSGREIVVDPAPRADDAAIRAFLLGSAMGALLHQRGLLPLHASAVAMGAVLSPSWGRRARASRRSRCISPIGATRRSATTSARWRSWTARRGSIPGRGG
ncbi:MAG: hypothetical protein ACRYFW_02615 [Janthinobacterium lividum]